MDSPLPAALAELTPAPVPQPLDADTIRAIVDALTAFGAGRPLGICLRRSLLRYYFLRRADVPVVVNFGARRLGERIGGHAIQASTAAASMPSGTVLSAAVRSVGARFSSLTVTFPNFDVPRPRYRLGPEPTDALICW